MALPPTETDQYRSPVHQTNFDVFFAESEPMLRRALVAQFGVDLGREAACEALAYGWKNWERLSVMDNPRGYLFRVAESWARRQRRRVRRPALFQREPARFESNFEPGLADAIEALSPKQRQVVALVIGFGYSYQQVADMLDLSRSSVQTHADRAMASLRKQLGVAESVGPKEVRP